MTCCFCFFGMIAFGQFVNHRNSSRTTIVKVDLYMDAQQSGTLMTTGAKKSLEVGEYNSSALGPFSKGISQISVPPALKIIVYKKDNFSGESTEFVGPASFKLMDGAWDNSISSIKVLKN